MILKWIEASNYTDLSIKAAEIFTEQLQSNSNSVFGLATGGTPEGFYKEWIRLIHEKNLSFKDAVTFNLDEYVGVDRENEASYYYYMQRHLFRYVDAQQSNLHIPNGLNPENAEEYDELIESRGGIDLQLLGLGINGHIGFNEPGTSFDIGTHIVELEESTREANSRYFDSKDEVPTHAVTMGIQSILRAKKIVLLISGKSKLEAINKLKSGIITTDFPASALNNHPNVTVIYYPQ